LDFSIHRRATRKRPTPRHATNRADSISHREDAKSAKRTDKNKAKEKIEQIAAQLVDAILKVHRALGPPCEVDVLNQGRRLAHGQ
jgi:hypothetical protein